MVMMQYPAETLMDWKVLCHAQVITVDHAASFRTQCVFEHICLFCIIDCFTPSLSLLVFLYFPLVYLSISFNCASHSFSL